MDKNKPPLTVEVECSDLHGFSELTNKFKEKLIWCSKQSRQPVPNVTAGINRVSYMIILMINGIALQI